MKALKEKRASLRSLFRGSLAILCVLALAFTFASCGDSDSGGTTTPPGGNGGNGGTTTPPAVTAVSIAILQQPQTESYLGCPPVLTGLIAHVRFSDGTDQVIAEGHALWENLITSPGYCDEATDIASATDAALSAGGASFSDLIPYLAITNIQLGYKGSSVLSSQLRLPLVIATDALQVTGSNVVNWYADQRPDFAGLSYEIIKYEGYWTYSDYVASASDGLAFATYNWGQGNLGPFLVTGTGASGTAMTNAAVTATATDFPLVYYPKGKGKYQKFGMSMTAAYPHLDRSQIETQKEIVVFVGGKKPYGYPVLNTTAVLHNPATLWNTKMMLATSFKITNYLKVMGVEFESAEFADYFDDQATYFGADRIRNAGGDLIWIVDKKPAIAAVMAAKPKFKVFYGGGESRSISMDEFLGNNAYYVVELEEDTSVFHDVGNNAGNVADLGGSIGGVTKANYLPQHAVVAADSIRQFIFPQTGVNAGTVYQRWANRRWNPTTFASNVFNAQDHLNIPILNVNDDTGNWNITLEYVPAYYLDKGKTVGAAWVSHVDIPFPVHVFDDQITVQANAANGLNHIRMIGMDYNATNVIAVGNPDRTWASVATGSDLGGPHGLTPLSAGQLQSINDKWFLVGNYSRGSSRKTRNIPFTYQMFYDGLQARSLSFGGLGRANLVDGTGSVVSLGTYYARGLLLAPAIANLKAGVIFRDLYSANGIFAVDTIDNPYHNAAGWNPAAAGSGAATPSQHQIPTGVVGRDWPLAVYYRGQYVDDDETVLIDLIGP